MTRDAITRHIHVTPQVSRWTKNVDVFSKRFLLIPVNEALHWSLALVVNPGI